MLVSMSPAPLRFVAPVLAITAAAMSMLIPAAAQAATTSYEATFAVQDAGVWGPGSGGSISKNSALLDLSWNESASAADVVDWDLPLDLATAQFGGSVSARTSGELGFDVGYDVNGGKLDVTYPAKVDISYPDAESFYPGDTITIATTQVEKAGRSFNYDAGEQRVKIKGNVGAHVEADAKVCVFTCSSVFDLFPDLTVPSADVELLNVNADPNFYTDLFQTTFEQEFATGISAHVKSPKPETALQVNTMTNMVSHGQQPYVQANFDVDSLSKYPWGQETPPQFGAGHASYDVIDGKIFFDAEQSHDFDFKPSVKVTFAFAQSLHFVEKTPAGAVVAQGTAASATITAGNKLLVDIPTTLTDPFTVTPTLSITNTLTHKFEHVYQTHGEVKALEVSAGLNATTLFPGTPSVEVCDPTGIGELLGADDCFTIPGIPSVVTPAWDLHVGPVYKKDIPIATLRPTFFNETWSMTGFASYPQPATTLDPENIPVAKAGGPYTVAEGASINLDATASFDLDANDPITYSWTLSRAGTIAGATTATPTFTGDDGGRDNSYVATVRVCDESGDCSQATATITVTNVAPVATLDVSRQSVFGTGSSFIESVGVPVTYTASAVDAGTDDTAYAFSAGSASVWTNATQMRFNNGSTADAAFSPFGTKPFTTTATAGVTFTEPGVQPFKVVVTDDDGGVHEITSVILISDTGSVRRPSGWFKQQYSMIGNRVLTPTQLAGYLAFTRQGSAVFGESVMLDTNAQADAVLSGVQTDRGQATSELLAAWLNTASGATPYTQALPAKLQAPGRTTVGAALREIEATVLNTAATKAQLTTARQLAQALYQA